MAATDDTLTGLQHHARVLLVFAPATSDARMEKQLRELQQNAAESAERNLVAIAVPKEGAAPTGQKLNASESAAVRRRFHVSDAEFLVVLIGKDGGEKLRSGKVLSFERLRAVIDAMPMRQQEMQKP